MILDVHTHTISSGHAYSSVKEMIDAARDKGLSYIGISDHAPNMPGSAYIYHFQNMKAIPREVDGVRVLRGVEANIIDTTGKIDMNEDNLQKLDYVIASMHPPCIGFGTKEENTRAMIGAIKNPYVNIIGHPDDSRFAVDYEAVVKAAKENNVLLEINNGSLNPEGFRQNAKAQILTYMSLCEKYNHPLIIGSDAHICYGVGDFSYVLPLLEETGIDPKLIANNDYDVFKKYINNNPF